MRFPKLNSVTEKEMEVPVGSLSLSNEEMGNKVFLSECKNLFLEGGALKTREGIKPCFDQPLYELDSYTDIYEPLKFTDTNLEINGKKYTVATIGFWENVSHVYIDIYLIGKNETIFTNTIEFPRVSSEEFYMPKKIKLFTGKATEGCGLYAFVELVDDYDSNRVYDAVFELSSDYQNWNRIYKFYCPVIYINGRGNLYDEIADAVYLDKPVELEQLNLIDNSFKAYFTSDGHSYSFQLPISSLDDENFICRVYSTPSSYTQWTVYGGKDTATATFNSKEVTLKVNRTTGTFEFSSSGSSFPMYKMNQFNSNNIEVLAYKTVEGGRRAVFGTEKCFVHNSHIYFYGDENSANKIFAARSEKPLYFPKDSVATIGNDNTIVKALSSSNGRLLAFKNDGIYEVGVTLGKPHASNELIIGVLEQFYKNDTFKCKQISSWGCEYLSCVCANKNILFWQGKGKQIYCLNNNDVRCVSKDIEDKLSSLSISECYSLMSVPYKDGIIIFNDNKAFVLQYINNTPHWFYWEFTGDLKINSAALVEDSLKLILTQNRKIIFLGEMVGIQDVIGYFDNTWEYKDIDFRYKTNNIAFKKTFDESNIYRFNFRGRFKDALKIVFYNERDNICSQIHLANINADNTYKTFSFRSNIRAVEGITLEMSGKTPFAISNINYKYH